MNLFFSFKKYTKALGTELPHIYPPSKINFNKYDCNGYKNE